MASIPCQLQVDYHPSVRTASGERSYSSSLRTSEMASSSLRSSRSSRGPSECTREKPVPVMAQPVRAKAAMTCRPRRPVAPVTSALGATGLTCESGIAKALITEEFGVVGSGGHWRLSGLMGVVRSDLRHFYSTMTT